MITFENSIVINRPVEDVFRFVADFTNVPQWHDAVREVSKINAGPIGMGTRFRQLRKTDGQPFIVTEYVPYQKAKIITEPDTWPKFEIEYRFEVVANGTRLTSIWRLELRYKLMTPLVTRRTKANAAKNLRNLKLLMETGQQAAIEDNRKTYRV